MKWKDGPYIRGQIFLVKGFNILKNSANAFFVLHKEYQIRMRPHTPRQWRLLFRERDTEVTQFSRQALLHVCIFLCLCLFRCS